MKVYLHHYIDIAQALARYHIFADIPGFPHPIIIYGVRRFSGSYEVLVLEGWRIPSAVWYEVSNKKDRDHREQKP